MRLSGERDGRTVVWGTRLADQGEVVKFRTQRCRNPRSGIISSCTIQSLAGQAWRNVLIRCKGEGVVFPAVIGSGFLSFQACTPRGTERSRHLFFPSDLFLVLLLTTCHVCDAASSAILGLLTRRLTTPLRHGGRRSYPPSVAKWSGRIRSLRQWLSTPCRIERNCRPYRSIQVSHNPPPHFTSSCTHCFI